MRAILIDPQKQAFTEIQITDSDAEHRAILQCKELHRVAVLGSDATGRDVIIVSNDGIDESVEFGFVLGDDRHGHRCHGYGLVLRFAGENETVSDLQISIEELAKQIAFTKPDTP
jgi:hypothetical protein